MKKIIERVMFLMKKFLMLFISILSLSFLLSINKVYAQEPINQYPNYIMLTHFNDFVEPIAYTNTYDFRVTYTIDNICIEEINQNDYFLVNEIGFRKGIDRDTNSYEIRTVWCSSVPYTRTWIQFNISVLKSYAYDNYNYPDNDENIELLFSRDTALYILYHSNTNSIEYDNGFNAGHDVGYSEGYNFGYNTGYNIGYNQGHFNGIGEGFNLGYEDGFNTGYDIGYTDGINATQEEVYQRGYEDGLKSTLGKFSSSFHTWIVPAIILVFAIGIFVTYRRGRE